MRVEVLAVSACLLTVATVFAADPKAEGSPETSKLLSFATYAETAGRVEVIVGSLTAGVAEHEKYIPLQFAVGVKGKGPELDITPDRFVLIDSEGNIYNAVSEYDAAKEEGALRYARAYNEQNPLNTGSEFITDVKRVMSDFYPLEGGKFYVESHLGRDSYLTDLLLFPNPSAGLGGVLTLQFLTPGMDEAVEVRFEVTPDHKKVRKQKKKLDKHKREAASGS